MIRINKLTVKNFMSVGNTTQGIDFDRQDLTLVLGENLDLGGDGSRNGTGKTTIINALSYALYGQALTNIRKDNLINKTNAKNMIVSLDFNVNNQRYRIERGRKPNVLKFSIDDEVQQTEDDNSQGDSRETQLAIERTLGMTHDMFKHILALNTYTEPFLSLKANDQRAIIEQLLGITLLSEKADLLKEEMRETKDAMSQEEHRIKAMIEANRRMEEQIESSKRRQTLWINKRDEDITTLQRQVDELGHLDIEAELQAHRDLVSYNQRAKDLKDLGAAIARGQTDAGREQRLIDKITKEIASLQDHRCHACGQDLHDADHGKMLTSKQQDLSQSQANLQKINQDLAELSLAVTAVGPLGTQPKVYYDQEADAHEHRSRLASAEQNLKNKQAETDPYAEQIEEMQQQALVEIDYDLVNQLKRLQDHQDFLLKLLTSKDSFVRKKIIDQNLSYLNSRLTHYLDRIGLPHTVVFQNDLTVQITELGRDLDFDNLSRGERNRLILSLSWAFRDVWESLYSPVNVLFIDELIDSGMDSSGVENALALLKKMTRERHKSVWLVSHKDELAGRVENILKVIKEGGFTSYATDVTN